MLTYDRCIIISISIYMCYQCVFSVMMTIMMMMVDNDDGGDDDADYNFCRETIVIL
jgi:hypothetical protein